VRKWRGKKGLRLHLYSLFPKVLKVSWEERFPATEAFRFNTRKADDSTRFQQAASGVVGKRLTNDALTGKVGQKPIPEFSS
jgi:hypothetical protein